MAYLEGLTLFEGVSMLPLIIYGYNRNYGATIILLLSHCDRCSESLIMFHSNIDLLLPPRYLEPGTHLEAQRPTLHLDRETLVQVVDISFISSQYEHIFIHVKYGSLITNIP